MGLLTDLKQNLKKGIESTSQRSKKLMDISRLNMAIKGKREEEVRLYRQLGKEAYHLWEQKEKWEVTDSIRATLQQIQSIRETIKQWEREVEELKKQEEKERLQEEQGKEQIKQAGEQHAVAEPSQPTPQAQQLPPPPKPESKPEAQLSSKPESQPEPKLPPSHEQTPQPKTSDPDLWAQLEGQALFICPHCGGQVKEDAVICSHCRKNMYYD
ncbi:hypothetical protein [Desmospora activa]|uniref:hypothetical protein n=1 Tax=Desmospora activa TaxID=500615 RepID=UPI000D300FDC|nr:hypothetical protein [Desmospora activa]